MILEVNNILEKQTSDKQMVKFKRNEWNECLFLFSKNFYKWEKGDMLTVVAYCQDMNIKTQISKVNNVLTI